jgi:hypothetical protein
MRYLVPSFVLLLGIGEMMGEKEMKICFVCWFTQLFARRVNTARLNTLTQNYQADRGNWFAH